MGRLPPHLPQAAGPAPPAYATTFPSSRLDQGSQIQLVCGPNG
jgi:hypothetical protein